MQRWQVPQVQDRDRQVSSVATGTATTIRSNQPLRFPADANFYIPYLTSSQRPGEISLTATPTLRTGKQSPRKQHDSSKATQPDAGSWDMNPICPSLPSLMRKAGT